MYKIKDVVYVGTRQLTVKDQRGRRYVNYKGSQVNVKDIPVLPSNSEETDCVYEYIFCGGFVNYRCFAMDYWIERHRMKRKITTKEFKQIHIKEMIKKKN